MGEVVTVRVHACKTKKTQNEETHFFFSVERRYNRISKDVNWLDKWERIRISAIGGTKSWIKGLKSNSETCVFRVKLNHTSNIAEFCVKWKLYIHV